MLADGALKHLRSERASIPVAEATKALGEPPITGTLFAGRPPNRLADVLFGTASRGERHGEWQQGAKAGLMGMKIAETIFELKPKDPPKDPSSPQQLPLPLPPEIDPRTQNIYEDAQDRKRPGGGGSPA